MSNQQRIAAIVGLALIGVYSWIMTTLSGTAGSWAWIILVGGIVVLVATGRSVAASRRERGGG